MICNFSLIFWLQALIDYIKSDFDMSVYWKTLNENGITKERLLSYDRGIHSEPNFRRDQKDGLLQDLGNYMRTLKVSFKAFAVLTFYSVFIFIFFIEYCNKNLNINSHLLAYHRINLHLANSIITNHYLITIQELFVTNW